METNIRTSTCLRDNPAARQQILTINKYERSRIHGCTGQARAIQSRTVLSCLQVQQQQQSWHEHYKNVQKASTGSTVSEAELIWALECVRSRAFSGPYSGVLAKTARPSGSVIRYVYKLCVNHLTHLCEGLPGDLPFSFTAATARSGGICCRKPSSTHQKECAVAWLPGLCLYPTVLVRCFHLSLSTAQCSSIGTNISVTQLLRMRSACHIGPPVKERAKAVIPFLLAALAYTKLAHLPLEQILNGAIAAVLFNIIYDTLLSRKLKWFAMCPVIDSMNHQSTSTVRPVYCIRER